MVYVAILGFQGVVEGVTVHRTMSAATQRVEAHLEGSGYSAERWFDALVETNQYPHEDYEPTNIYGCEFEER